MTRERTELLLHFYRDMLRIRYFEEKILHHLLPNRLFRGSSHLYMGQEAVGVGVVHAMRESDYLITSHRGHGHCLARGMDMAGMFAEIMGRRTGVCRGKGGSMHLADASLGILGENPVVGSNIPMAAGAALALKMQGKEGVVLAFFGDGAANTGAFHEGLNMAALWDLPVVFVCENNRYAISVTFEDAQSQQALHERAVAYGIDGHAVDGMNVLEVYDAAKQAIDKARSECRPSFLVFDTYRFAGHHTNDSEQYRPKEEPIQVLRERDPIHFVEHEVFAECEVDVNDLIAIRDELHAEVEAAFETAHAAPWPELEEIWDGLTVQGGVANG